MVLIERAPPVRVVAAVTLVCAVLDVFADIILCTRFALVVDDFGHPSAIRAVYFYYTFTAVSGIIFVIEIVDVVLTLKNNMENKILTPLAKSLNLVFEEVPLPICLLLIYTLEPRTTLATPAMLASCIKLIALLWGIIKFIKMKFCWFFLPCTMDHGFRENMRRCFIPRWWRVAMLIVNICHVLSICIVITNITLCSRGGKTYESVEPTQPNYGVTR